MSDSASELNELCRVHEIDVLGGDPLDDLDALLECLSRRIDAQKLARFARDAGLQQGRNEAGQEQEQAHAEALENLYTELARLAHKLNNPLTALLGRSQILVLKKGDDPEIGKGIRVVDESSKRIAVYVKELSELARMRTRSGLASLLDPRD